MLSHNGSHRRAALDLREVERSARESLTASPAEYGYARRRKRREDREAKAKRLVAITRRAEELKKQAIQLSNELGLSTGVDVL